mmetsp:Transcript_13540/g.37556  ORF Transcript_13540/g.37556 Transcript_13540/m.37556 type:complete len:245 (-) Transcript_13540:161-895(-)
MGLKEAELLDAGAVSETLKCPVCFEVFDDPVFCGGRPCQHVFCRECLQRALEQTEQCPTCRAEVQRDELQPHQAIRSLLDELPVRCMRGCGWTGRRDARAAHAEVCPVKRLEAANAELAQFADISRQLAERDMRIADLEARVAEQDIQVVNVSRELVEREVRIQELEKYVAKQDAALLMLRKRLSEVLGETSNLDEEFAEELLEEEELDEESAEEQQACERRFYDREITGPLQDNDGSAVDLWL